jgi:acetate kinase
VSHCIAVINAGSSSIKFALYKAGARESADFRGQVAGIGAEPSLRVRNAARETVAERSWPGNGFDHRSAIGAILETARELLGGTPVAAVGHRVVHGGTRFREPVRIDGRVRGELEALCPLAPLHQPHNIAAIAAIAEGAPHIPQVACFDTAFHRDQPELAQMFALPRELTESGIRRYGFHGLSYEYIADKLPTIAPELAKGRVVVAHLGSGASMCAIHAGKSVECTLGFTALDGLPMGTRPGQLDPGIVLYLMSEKGMSAKEIERFLYNECGLKGLSGISNDVRDLLESRDPRAKRALDHFVYRIALAAGMLASAMGGIDGFVFTAGIGENAPQIREAVAKRLAWLGLELDAEANGKGGPRISGAGSRVACYVIPTDEELMIARHTLRVLRTHAAELSKEKSA